MTTTNEPTFDALLPHAMAARAEHVDVNKARLETANTFMPAVLAGAFIALGAGFATTVTAGASGVLTYGVTRLLGGLVFSLGLLGGSLFLSRWAFEQKFLCGEDAIQP